MSLYKAFGSIILLTKLSHQLTKKRYTIKNHLESFGMKASWEGRMKMCAAPSPNALGHQHAGTTII